MKQSKASTMQRRSAAFKSGRYAKSVTQKEAVTTKLLARDSRIPPLLEVYIAASHGDMDPLAILTAQRFVQAGLVFEDIAEDLRLHGAIWEESVMIGTLNAGTRRVASPLLKPFIDMMKALGVEAKQQLQTPEAAGTGAKDQADAVLAAHRAKLIAKRGGLPDPVFKKLPPKP